MHKFIVNYSTEVSSAMDFDRINEMMIKAFPSWSCGCNLSLKLV